MATVWISSEGLTQTSQRHSPQLLPRLPLQRTRPLPEPLLALISQPPSASPPATRSNDPLLYGPPGWNHPCHQQTPVTPAVAGLSQRGPGVFYESPPLTQPTPMLPPFSQLPPVGMLATAFSPQFHPFYHSQPLSLPSPTVSQEVGLTFPSLLPVAHSQPIFQVPSPSPSSHV